MTIIKRLDVPAVWAFLLLCLLTAIIYLPGLSGDYMFDDRPNLLENSKLELESLSLDALLNASYSSVAGSLRRPLSMASFALNRYFFGIDPWSHKLVNLAIHLLTGLGLFWLGTLVMRSYRRCCNPQYAPDFVRWLPVLLAGLWLVHPLNLSTVLYIIQRMAGLSALFTVFGLCLYLTGRLRMHDGKSGLVYILAGLFGFGGLAILSKENGILMPLYMLCLEATLFRFRNAGGGYNRTIIGFFVVTLVLPAMLVLLVLMLDPGRLVNYDGRTFTLAERLLTEPRVLLFYLKMIVMPSVTELGLFHDDITLSQGLLDPPATLVSIIVIAGMLLTALLLPIRHALVSLGILWFFAGHVLESSFIALELAHEHRNYLADYGILLAACAFISTLEMQQLRRAIHIGGPALFLLMLSYTTWVRATQWSDNVDHALFEAAHHPESFRAVFSAGRIHARLALNGVDGSDAQAFSYLDKASRLDRYNIMPDVTKVLLSYYLDRPVHADSFADIRRKLEQYPVSPSDIVSLKDLTECFGESCDFPADIMDGLFETALQKNHSTQLMTIYGFYRINKLADPEGGLEIFRKVIDKNPRESQHWINLINLLLVMERHDEAAEQLKLFRASDSYGGNQSLYRMLENEIAYARDLHSSQSNMAASGEEHQ